MFSHLAGRHSARVESALMLLSRKHREVIADAYGSGDRSAVKWDIEAEAIGELGRALELLTPERAMEVSA